MGRIGILGGTFDPPHQGHLILAEAARDQLGLDQVLFVPAGEPPHKHKRQKSSAQQRLEMIADAIANQPHFTVSRLDIDRPSPHFTATLLPLIAEAYPDSELWLIMGADSLRDFAYWHQPQQIITSCRIALLPRPGAVINWVALTQKVPGVDAIVDTLSAPAVALSSTDIRHRARSGRSLRYLVPESVRSYIVEQQLYPSL